MAAATFDRGSSSRRSASGILRRIRQYSLKRRKTSVKKGQEEEEEEEEPSSKKMADNHGNGGRHTLPGPSSSKEPRMTIEPRKRRFQPFRVVRKIFRRKSKSSYKEEDEDSGRAPHLKSRSTSELLVANCREERGASDVPQYATGLSLSHDSIFAPESEEVNPRQQEKHFVHSPKRFSVKRFKEELLSKFRPRQDSDEDDAGLPRSPCTSPTTVEVLHQGLKGKSEKFRSSDGSLLSMGSSGTDTEEYGGQNLVFDRQPVNSDPDLNVGATLLLDNQAARHRIAVRPRRTHAITLNRRIHQVSTGSSLPTTPEDTEEAAAVVDGSSRSAAKMEPLSPPVRPKPSSGKLERPSSLQIQPQKPRSSLVEETAETEEKVASPPPPQSENKRSRSKSRAARQKVEHEIKKFHERESPEKKLPDAPAKEGPAGPKSPDFAKMGPLVVENPCFDADFDSRPKKAVPERAADEKRSRRRSRHAEEKILEKVSKPRSPEADEKVLVKVSKPKSPEMREKDFQLRSPAVEGKSAEKVLKSKSLEIDEKILDRISKPKSPAIEEKSLRKLSKPRSPETEEKSPQKVFRPRSSESEERVFEKVSKLKSPEADEKVSKLKSPEADEKVSKPRSLETERKIISEKVSKLKSPEADEKVSKLKSPEADGKVSKLKSPEVDEKASKLKSPEVDEKASKLKSPDADEKVSKSRSLQTVQKIISEKVSKLKSSEADEKVSKLKSPDADEKVSKPRSLETVQKVISEKVSKLKSPEADEKVSKPRSPETDEKVPEKISKPERPEPDQKVPKPKSPETKTGQEFPVLREERSARRNAVESCSDEKRKSKEDPRSKLDAETAVPDDANKVVIAVAQSETVQVQSEGLSQMRISPPNRQRKPLALSHSLRRKSNRIEQLSQNLFGNPQDGPEPVPDFLSEVLRGTQSSSRAEDPAAKSDKSHHHVLYVPAERSHRAEPSEDLREGASGAHPDNSAASTTRGRRPEKFSGGRVPAVVLPRAPDPGPSTAEGPNEAAKRHEASHAGTLEAKRLFFRKADGVQETSKIAHRLTEPNVALDETVQRRTKRQPINQQLSQEDIDQLEEEQQAINCSPPSPKPRKVQNQARPPASKPEPLLRTVLPERLPAGEPDITIVESARLSPRPGPGRKVSRPEGTTRLPPLEILPYAPAPSPPRTSRTGESRKVSRADSDASSCPSPLPPQAETPPYVPKPVLPRGAAAEQSEHSAAKEPLTIRIERDWKTTLRAEHQRPRDPVRIEVLEPAVESRPLTKSQKTEAQRPRDPPVRVERPEPARAQKAESPRAKEAPEASKPKDQALGEPASEENEIQRMLRKLSMKRNSSCGAEPPAAEATPKQREKPAAEAKEVVILVPAAGGKRAAAEKKAVSPVRNKSSSGEPPKTEDKPLESNNNDGSVGNSNKGAERRGSFRKVGAPEQAEFETRPVPTPYTQTLRALRKVSVQAAGEPSRKVSVQAAGEPSRKEPDAPRLGHQEQEQKMVIEEVEAKKGAAAEAPKRPQSIPLVSDSQRLGSNTFGRVSASAWMGRGPRSEPCGQAAESKVLKSPGSPKESEAPADASGEVKPVATAAARFAENGGSEVKPGWMKDLRQKNEMKKQQVAAPPAATANIIIESKPAPNRSSKVLDLASTFQHRVTS